MLKKLEEKWNMLSRGDMEDLQKKSSTAWDENHSRQDEASVLWLEDNSRNSL